MRDSGAAINAGPDLSGIVSEGKMKGLNSEGSTALAIHHEEDYATD